MEDDLKLFHRTECPDLTEDEFALFVRRCEKRGIDPLLRFVVPQLYVDKRSGKRKITDITTIDAYRSIAQSTGEYRGQTDPVWFDGNGKPHAVWISGASPQAALVKIYREGFVEAVGQPAHFSEYARTYNGKPSGTWATMGALMLAKCSEALGFRKAFPEQLSGTYTADEMQQAKNEHRTTETLVEVDRPAVSIESWLSDVSQLTSREALVQVWKKARHVGFTADELKRLVEACEKRTEELLQAEAGEPEPAPERDPEPGDVLVADVVDPETGELVEEGATDAVA